MKAIFLSLVIFCGVSVHAKSKVLSYKPLSLQVEKGDRIQITGFYGEVKVQVVPDRQTVTVQLRQKNPDDVSSDMKDAVDEWLFSLQKEQNVVQVHVRSPQSKGTWSRILSRPDEQPRFEMSIQMPSLPTEVSWRSGNVEFHGLKDNLKVFNQSGNVKVSDHSAPLEIQHQTGNIFLTGIEGEAHVDTYSGKVMVKEMKGRLHLKNFNGSSEVIQPEGQVEFVTFGGDVNLKGGKGKLEYTNEKGKVKVDKFEGDIRGRAEQGSLVAVLQGKSNVRVSSKEGSVSLQMLNSSASINAGSKEGSMNTPQFLRLTRLPNLRLVRGRLRGKNPGQVHVRTESGDIRIR